MELEDGLELARSGILFRGGGEKVVLGRRRDSQRPGSAVARMALGRTVLTMALCCAEVLAQGGPPAGLEAALAHGAQAMRSGDGVAAESAFREAVRLAPRLPEAHLDLGLVLGREGKMDDALVELRRAVTLDAKLPAVHLFLGIFLYQTNQAEPARRELQAELSLDPKNVEALTWLGTVDLAQGHPEKAVLSFDRAAELAPDDLNLLEFRGRAHNQVAHDSYARMARLAPNSWHVRRVQAQLYSDEGRHTEAVTEYKAAIQGEPRNSDLYEGLGDEYRKLSQLDEAKAAYTQELALTPNSPIALYNLGSTEVEQGQAEAGIPLLERMLQLAPGSPVAEYYLGRGLATQEKDEQAASWLSKAAAADQDGEVAKRSWYELARVYHRLHREPAAQAALASYKRLREAAEKQSSQEAQDWRKLQAATGSAQP